MAGEPEKTAYRCPGCGERVHRPPEDGAAYTCPQCGRRYAVIVAGGSGLVAFVDQSEKPAGEPLGLPRGSIRALIALLMAGTCAALAVAGRPVPGSLTSLLLAIVGFYFGFRVKAASMSDRIHDPAARREQPLYLPGGVIRLLLIAAILVMGACLFLYGHLGRPGYLELTVILIGMVLGHFFRRLTGRSPGQGLNHLLGVLGMLLAVAAAVIFLSGADESLPPHLVMAVCAAISFYFGSRS